jgi:Helix-turn-helix domain
MSQATARKKIEITEPVRVLGRGLKAQRGIRMSLRGIREAVGKTQVEVSRISAIDQADVSRLEQRAAFDDCQIDTLKRYIAAIGGDLEIVATFGDKKITLAGANAAPPANKALQRPVRKAPRR